MTRELNQLIKRLKTLSPDEIARVQQFLQQSKSPELRVVPLEIKAVPEVNRQNSKGRNSMGRDSSGRDSGRQDSNHEGSNPEAEVAHAACALWRRRPFQAIDADDLQPIAALFREAVDTRAASRFRFGSR